ncbi:MAG: phage tail sheath C-terminal domain-containing protein [Oscillospiraceae bacterium]
MRGLPEINIVFKTKGSTIIERSSRGIVACIIKDDTADGLEFEVLNRLEDVDFTKYDAKNYSYLSLIFKGKPIKVIVVRIATIATDYNAPLKKLKDLKWNYLTIPNILKSDVTTISSWIKTQREEFKKTFKAVLPQSTADHEGIINFTTDTIKTVDSKSFNCSEYCARIAGVLAGLSLARSSTYFVLDDVISAAVPDDPNERINAGELIIVFDSTKYKIGRGVNSLTTFTPEKGEDFGKIKIIEGQDLYQDDIRSTFEDFYIGKVINDYDNKQAFIASINNYHKQLLGDVLDSSFQNIAKINISAQRKYLEDKQIDISTMDDVAISQANTGSTVFISSNVKFVDAMEDFNMEVNM